MQRHELLIKNSFYYFQYMVNYEYNKFGLKNL